MPRDLPAWSCSTGDKNNYWFAELSPAIFGGFFRRPGNLDTIGFPLPTDQYLGFYYDFTT